MMKPGFFGVCGGTSRCPVQDRLVVWIVPGEDAGSVSFLMNPGFFGVAAGPLGAPYKAVCFLVRYRLDFRVSLDARCA